MGQALEYFDEIVVIDEADPVPDFMYRQIGVQQIVHRFFHPDPVQVVNQRLSGFFLEQGADVVFAHHHVLGHRLDRDVLRIVLGDIL